VHSARWAGEAKDFAAAMARVNREMADAADRRAWFVAVLCLAWPDGATATFVGRIDGTATWPPRGTKGFGYDPMFVPAGATLTFGEMEAAEKHTVSHRARAFVQMLAAAFRGGKAGRTVDAPWKWNRKSRKARKQSRCFTGPGRCV
jgi:XTP/dITP diphosphohydrolase